MRARKASKPAAADTARELRGNAKLDQLSARKLPGKKWQVAVYDGRLRLGAARPRQARRRGARRARPQPWLLCQHRQTLMDAAILKSIGSAAGIPDIVVVYRGRVYAREENGEKERSP